MKKNLNNNIFNEASKKFKKTKKKKAVSSFLLSETLPDITSPKTDAEALIERMRKMNEDLENKITHICELSGMTRQQVNNFIENPSNFTPEQWKKAQRKTIALEEKINAVAGAVGVEVKKRKLKKKNKKLAKGRLGKTLGARKGWLQM